MMAETDGSSGTGSSGSGDTSSATMTSTTLDPTMTSNATTEPQPTSTLTTSMTGDPDTSSAGDTAEDTSTGECTPGTEGCPCDIGSACEGELLCEAGVCVAVPACAEPDVEPNDDEASAFELEGVNCGVDAQDGAGGFDGAESDWFVFSATDQIACFSGPTIEVESEIDVAVCAFVSCNAGSNTVMCGGGSDEADSPDGLPGCCNQGSVDLDFNCTLAAANADIFVRVTSIDAACSPYTFTYAY